MYKSPALLISLFLCSYLWSSAQIDTFGTTVLGTNKAIVAKPNKQFSSPVINEPESKLPTFSYDIPKFLYKVDPLYSPAKAIGIKPGAGEDLFGNYTQLGFGNLLTTYGNVHLHNLRDPNYDYGGYLHHLSSNKVNPKFADFSENAIGIYGKKYGRRGKLSGRLDYNRDVIHYYGFRKAGDSVEIEKKDINQIYNRFDGKTLFELKTNRNIKKLDLGFDFYTLSNLGSRENEYKAFNQSWFGIGKGIAGINTEVEFINLKTDTNTFNRTFITAHPFYKFVIKKFNLDLGLNIIFYGDSSGFKPYVLPNINASTYIVPDKLLFYAGFNGGIVRNSLNELTTLNPFAVANPQIKNTVMPVDLKAGLKGIVLKKMDFILEVRNRLFNDHAFFVTDSGYRRNFQVVYDNLNVLSLRTDVSFNLNEKLFIGLGNELFNYSNLKSEDHPWQLPAYKLNANASYTFAKKLNIRLQVYVLGDRHQRDPLKTMENTEKLPAIADINLLTQYKYKENISFFINVHNITNSKYQQWYNYNVYGLNVLGGVKFSL